MFQKTVHTIEYSYDINMLNLAFFVICSSLILQQSILAKSKTVVPKWYSVAVIHELQNSEWISFAFLVMTARLKG